MPKLPARPPAIRPLRPRRQRAHSVQDGSDDGLVAAAALVWDGSWRLPEPGKVPLACLEQLIKYMMP